MAALDVVCVGSANLDTIAVVPFIPGDDERILSEEFVTAGGGPAATAAVTLARLGAKVGFCGVVGDDDAGRLIRDGLEREGVVLDWLTVVPGATTQSCVLVSSSSAARTIVTQKAREPRYQDVPVGVSTWLHVDQTGVGPARRALAESSARTLLSIDGGNPFDFDDLRGVELYAPSVATLRAHYPSAPDTSSALGLALSDGARWVVATAGADGAYVRSSDIDGRLADSHVPAFALPVVSTLGAGDVFHGALLAGILSGASVPEATREASAVAALSCRAIDGRSAIPDRRELDEFLHAERAKERSANAVTT
jgi:sugar/nucleoside kinase (ribokinase family)